ncbi:hypothetical protein Micbo1qcDRAFT_25161 [Microdochium bolleyi]|uniref:Uncharacterized protein n=1 Tax=Microdochium bolleyi TaxID=196109 RepID=A0A136JDK6_9PEZI|nr:hypothetical protein Micbo1qcDRAFT_25161 [Microdochium bolleyi]
MGWLKPFRLLVVPVVLVVAIPLAICAGLTTVLAFLVLFFRLFVVYFDLAIDTLRYVVLGRSIDSTASLASTSSQATTPAPSSPTQLSPRRRRNRRDSLTTATTNTIPNVDGALFSLGSALERDFEGVGGWRLKSAEADPDGLDDQQWFNLNSRLAMPERKHHFRTQSGGDIKSASRSAIGLYGLKGPVRGGPVSPENFRMTTSPSQLRARTPTGMKQRGLTRVDQDGYFPPYDSRAPKRIVV